MHWAGEDWDDFISQDEDHHHHRHSSKKTSTKASKTVTIKRESKSCDPSHHEIIKIRLTKKQLQDLLSKVNVHDLTGYAAPDLDRKTEDANQHRLWKPVLQSIPEVN